MLLLVAETASHQWIWLDSRVNWIKRWIRVLLRRPFHAKILDAPPDRVSLETVYITVISGTAITATMLCPCGCASQIDLNLDRHIRPYWSLIVHWNGAVSLSPSVWRTSGCRSHFWLKNGRLHQCNR